MRRSLPPISTKKRGRKGASTRHLDPPSRQVYAIPVFPFVPSKKNLFKLKRQTVSLFPLCYRDNDPISGYVGYKGARDKVSHETFGRFPPQKLYRRAGHELVPIRRSKPTLVQRSKRKQKKYYNPFRKNHPSNETAFLVSRSKRLSP